MITCKCGVRCDALTSYFGVPLHQWNTRKSHEYRVCRLWSGLPR